MKKTPFLASVIISVLFWNGLLFAGETMDNIERTGTIKIGWRNTSPPFGYVNPQTQKHEGFAIDMGNLLADRLSARFGKKIEVIPVTINASQRIPFLVDKQIDIEMGNTTHTQDRDLQVDFSLSFFFSDTTFIIPKKSNIKSVTDLNGKRIGVVKATTNLVALQTKMKAGIFTPAGDFILFEDHNQGLEALEKNTIDIYCGDRSILGSLRLKLTAPDDWQVADFAVAYEPYGFMVRKGNSDFRDFVDNFIVWTIQTKEFFNLYDKWMGPNSTVPIAMSQSYRNYTQLINYPLTKDWWKKQTAAK